MRAGNETYTVVRDAFQENQWYYVPDRPRLFERKSGVESEPEFQLIRYQFADPKDPGKPLEGGILQFSVTLDLPSGVIDDLRQNLAKELGGRGKASVAQLRLAPLPLKSAQVAIYAAKDGVLIPSDSYGTGMAPTFASQKMVFSVPLTQIGADIYDALVNGNTGVPVAVTMTYGGLTPPAGFKVTIDWSQAYDFYSRETKFRARSGWWAFKAQTSVDRQQVTNELTENKCIAIEVVEGSGFTQADAYKYIDPILARINAELLEKIKPPQQINAAVAPDPKAGGWFGGVGYAVSVKKISEVKSGKEEISLQARMYQERITRCDGFVGIGNYPEELRDRLVTFVELGKWDRAFFFLPAMVGDPRLGLQSVDMRVALLSGDEEKDSSAYRWTLPDGWVATRNQAPQRVAFFPLAGYRAQLTDAQFKSLKFSVRMTVVQANGGHVTAEREVPVFNGEQALASLPEMMDRIGIDGSNLAFNQFDDKSNLLAVQVDVRVGDRRFQETIRPRQTNGQWLPPDTVFFLVPRTQSAGAQVMANITFVTREGKRVAWKHNGKDLRQSNDFPDLQNVILLDGDWRMQ